MRSRLPPLNALRSFEAAARNGSFKDAANELYVSHSAISHQIKSLERHLGVELFVRKSRSVELTKQGKMYYPVIRDAFDRIADSTELLLSPMKADILTITLYSTFAIRWLIPRMPSFYARHKDIQIRLNTSQMDVDFLHDDVDLCVMIGSPDASDLHYDYLFSSEMYPVCSPALLTRNEPLNGPADLAAHTLLQVYPSDRDWRAWIRAHKLEDTLDPNSGLQFDSYDHALSTAVQGMGVALGMQPYIDRDIKSGYLVEAFPGARVAAPGEWYLVCRRDRARSEKVCHFRDWLQEQIIADPALHRDPARILQ
ncbi:MAG: transcriptional regulator GcvA [Pseudomonadales bacterium]